MSEPEQRPQLGGIAPERHRIRVEFHGEAITAIEVDGLLWPDEPLSPCLDRAEEATRRIVWALRELATFPAFPFHRRSDPTAPHMIRDVPVPSASHPSENHIPPPDIWPRLVESIELGQYDGVSGLCWTRTQRRMNGGV